MNKPVYKLINKNDIYDIDSFTLSSSKYVDILIDYPHKIDWFILSSNRYAINIIKDNLDKIDWEELSANENAIDIIKDNLNKPINWEILSTNINAYDLLFKNQDKIDWEQICLNTNSKIIRNIIKPNLFTKNISWDNLSQNTSDDAINILKQHQHKINWYYLSSNSNNLAVELLMDNLDKIIWYKFTLNKNSRVIDLFNAYPEKLNWEFLYYYNYDIYLKIYKLHPSYSLGSFINYEAKYNYFDTKFTFDYNQMIQNNLIFKEELIQKVMEPKRIFNLISLYGSNYLDMSVD